MSPLTKIFVVLHVILSVMLTAGLVVFVNKIEQFKLTNAGLQTQLNTTKNDVEAAKADAAAVRAAAKTDREAAIAQVEAVRGLANSLQTQISERDVRLVENASTLAQLTSAQTKTAQALAASLDQNSKQNEAIVALRTNVDDLTKRNSEQNTAISDLTNKLEVALRDGKWTSEQLVESREQADRYSKIIRDMGGSTDSGVQTGMRASAPRINGVVRGVRVIEGVTYATISVGSAEGVIKGMRFFVVDLKNRGEFLGELVIDQVDSNEATGRLEGPKVAEVKEGVEVRTQL